MNYIYGLIDPRDQKVKYVGRTKQDPHLRFISHLSFYNRNKSNSNKHLWLKDLYPLVPELIILETVEPCEAIAAEEKWINSFEGLTNMASAHQGGDKSYSIIWTPELDALLGKLPDSEIAIMINATRKSVSYRRKVLGIPASYCRKNNTPPPPMGGHNKIELPEWVIKELGKHPDYKLGKMANVSKYTIQRARVARGIASFAKQTGNNGTFKKGNFPGRWLK